MKQGWKIKKLGEVGTVITGSTPSTKDEDNYSSKDYCFVKPSDISNESISLIQETEAYISEKAYSKCRKLPQGSVLTTCIGIIGKVGILKVDATCNQQINGIIPNKDIIISEFLAYSLISCKKYLQGIANAPVVPIINKKEFSEVSIPVPPLSEQEKIVAELDCLSGVIEKKKQQLKELDALAESIFYTMFGDPITNEKGWEVKKLSDAVSDDCPISYGIVQPMEDIEGGIPIVRPIDLVDTFVRKDNLKRTSTEISNAYKRTILRGDEILMCVRGTTGVVSMASDELKGCNTTRGIVPLFFDSINRWFVYYLIKQQSMQCLIADNTYGIALKQINIKELRLLPIIAPPLTFQQEFADKIEAIEKQKELIKQSITETEELFNSRMDYYFN